ncbi:NUDIX hydrolase [Flexivirga caeni]|uniref:NUDIX hydrolase n=1 Tax=Flexivirga caeni TaxID=2294115 RepID=A0A3M9MKY8_9MICO|nr:NUDIX hydrolase [Flexivirga caeni]RNI25338.1 NUDIX hydrolase [Flexivirga caeni]
MANRRYASVVAFEADSVALVRESYPAWGGSFWSVPSGGVEEDETPAEGAARELAEETGLTVDPAHLVLVSTSRNRLDDAMSEAWNYVGRAGARTLQADDPDGIIEATAWFTRDAAIQELTQLPYAPLREPALALLSAPDSLRSRSVAVVHWEFENGSLVGSTTRSPS